MKTILTLLLLCAGQDSPPYELPEDPLVRAKLERWQDLKFGLLMHWGTYSQWGIVESWTLCSEDQPWCSRGGANYVDYVRDYERLIETFDPVAFDPGPWAQAAKDAGMRYVVFTTKHHDGFAMFDTALSDRFQTSERALGHALRRAVREAQTERDEFVVVTKGGALTPDPERAHDYTSAQRDLYSTYIDTGILAPDDIHRGHSLAPDFLLDQIQLGPQPQELGLTPGITPRPLRKFERGEIGPAKPE